MISPCLPSRRDRRQGFTLIEVVLTLCILVILAGFTWPALQGPLAAQRLRKAADLVRAKWVAARVAAMGSGEPHVFQYAAGGDRFSIQCRPASTAGADQVFGEEIDVAGLPSMSGAKEFALPEGVSFVGAETAADTRAIAVQSRQQPLGEEAAMLTVPILFYPDGTTSTARLVLKNDRGRCIELSLRGQTGVARVSRPFTPLER